MCNILGEWVFEIAKKAICTNQVLTIFEFRFSTIFPFIFKIENYFQFLNFKIYFCGPFVTYYSKGVVCFSGFLF